MYDKLKALTEEAEMRNVGLCLNYDDWIHVGLSLAGELGAAGESLFFRLSAIRYEKYSQTECRHKWKSLLASKRSVNIGWLINHAKANGLQGEWLRGAGSWRGESSSKGLKGVSSSKSSEAVEPLMVIPAVWPSRCCRTTSTFVKALIGCGIVTAEQASYITALYLLGARKDGRVIFWQIDEQQRVREGKVMLYGADCHRCHQVSTTWMGYLMRTGQDLDPATGQRILPADWKHTPCLFGQHLLPRFPQAPVCIVEAEKTAVICAVRLASLQCVWLATGGLGMLKPESMKVMKGRDVILFPDTDPEGETFRRWSNIGFAAQQYTGRTIRIYDGLERMATAQQKTRKIDIADLIIEAPPHHDDAALLFPEAIVPGSALSSDLIPPAAGTAPDPHEEPDLFTNPDVQELIQQFDLIGPL